MCVAKIRNIFIFFLLLYGDGENFKGIKLIKLIYTQTYAHTHRYEIQKGAQGILLDSFYKKLFATFSYQKLKVAQI